MVGGRVAAIGAVLLVPLVACADSDDGADEPAAVTTGTVAVAPLAPVAATTEPAPTPSATVTIAPTTAAATTVAPTTGVAGPATDALAVREIGRSVEGRPLAAVQRGTLGGTRVLVIGVIHGDEDDGVAILERLATAPVPEGIELWLVGSMNPDGQAAQRRGNAAGVDLNRNFPHDWGPIGGPGDGEYAGTGPASEPETQAVVELVDELGPALVLWYHQDLFRLSPGEGLEGQLKQRYAERTGLPMERITGGTYTGVAATWVRQTTDAISFIIELGPSLTPAEADTHTAAVLEIATLL